MHCSSLQHIASRQYLQPITVNVLGKFFGYLTRPKHINYFFRPIIKQRILLHIQNDFCKSIPNSLLLGWDLCHIEDYTFSNKALYKALVCFLKNQTKVRWPNITSSVEHFSHVSHQPTKRLWRTDMSILRCLTRTTRISILYRHDHRRLATVAYFNSNKAWDRPLRNLVASKVLIQACELITRRSKQQTKVLQCTVKFEFFGLA